MRRRRNERPAKQSIDSQSVDPDRLDETPEQRRSLNTAPAALPEDGGVQRPKTHQIFERRFMEQAGGFGGGAKGILIQEEGDEQLQQDGHQLRT